MLEINEELRDLIPPLTDDEYRGLENSIIEDGCIDPIIVWGNVVAILVVCQMVLGVSTLIGFGIWAPPQIEGVLLGIAHQGLGAILFASSMMLMRASLKPRGKPRKLAV